MIETILYYIPNINSASQLQDGDDVKLRINIQLSRPAQLASSSQLRDCHGASDGQFTSTNHSLEPFNHTLFSIRCFPSVVSKQKIGFFVVFQRVAYCTKAMVSSVLAITYLASHILSLATIIQKQRRHPFVMSDTGGEWF
jgi:hypothetical protein